jgi:hypothetical protein
MDNNSKNSSLAKIEEELDETRIEELVQIIIRQTDYSICKARENLIELDYDHIKVIKKYLGIPEKKTPVYKSVNQEIYKQLRVKMGSPVDQVNFKKIEQDL